MNPTVIYAVAAVAALAAPVAALANSTIALSSDVRVERTMTTVDGQKRIVLEEPKTVVPGDRLVFTIRYRNGGAKPVTDFAVTNPIPAAVRFAGQATPGATVSVDAGRTWGALAALKVRGSDGVSRPAQDADVTHVRWVLASAITPGASGALSFRGAVR